MHVFRCIRRTAVALAAINLVLPLHFAVADDPAGAARPVSAPRLVTRDVDLGNGQTLRGQLVDLEGRPLANQTIVAVQGDGQIATAVSDGEGRFAFDGLTAGVYQVQSAQSLALCRCWANNTAPPAAVDEILLVADGATVRGQRPIGEILSGPVLIALIIAAAIAIPIAIHESQDSAS